MLKKGLFGVLALVLIFGMASVALAEDGSAKAAGMWIFFAIALACGFGIGIAALGTGLGMGNAINAALTGIARISGTTRSTYCVNWISRGNVAENNHFHHDARWDRVYRSGISLQGAGNRASHNLIHNDDGTSKLIIDFADGLDNQTCYKIDLSNNIHQLEGMAQCFIKSLEGDVDSDAVTDSDDATEVATVIGRNPSLSGCCIYDINTDGIIDANDVLAVETNIGSKAICKNQNCTAPGDFDGDGDVDQSDFGHLQVCLSGDVSCIWCTGSLYGIGCEDADFDGDGDVDQYDVSTFLRCMSGANVPADPGCIGTGSMPGNFNGDSWVDFRDLDLFLQNWPQGYDLTYDLNYDTLINLYDFAILANDWVKRPPRP